MFARPLMWNVPHWAEITLYVMIPLVLIAIVAGIVWRARRWFLGQPDPAGNWLAGLRTNVFNAGRLTEFVKNALFQWRLSRDSYATWMHLAIFWGMVILAVGTALATIDQDVTNLPFDFQILTGNVYRGFELALDVFGVALLVGLAMAAYRRYAVRPERLTLKTSAVSKWDTFPFLMFLALIAVTGFLAEGLRLAEGFQIEQALAQSAGGGLDARMAVLEAHGVDEQLHLIGDERREAEMRRIAAGGRVFPAAVWAPVGYGLGRLLAPLSADTIDRLHQVTWWAHALLAFGFLIAIPFTKAFHLISSPLNMLLRSSAPVGRLPVAAESGVSKIGDFTWRQLLEIDSCTWCGKCQEVCPGFASGFPLSPRDVVQRLDGVLIRTAAKGGNGAAESLHGDVVPAEELWACCTCRACEDVCPVCVEHPRLLIDMRRHLVDQGEVDEGLQDALMNLQRYGNSFGQSARKRAAWAKDLGFTFKDAKKEEAEYLWFLGDYASYDQRVQEVTKATAQVLHRAGLDVGLLGDKEQNAGNDVRRVGEEGLFDLLREKNNTVLSKATFGRVITTDPHSYNTLKHEYGADGPAGGENGDSPLTGKPIQHYTELFDELLAGGKLTVRKRLGYKATYHDPCFLGRYNGVYDAPRRVLAALGVELVEMPRCRENSFCCGAGGGRIWMKDAPGIEERPAEIRVKEALELPGVEYFVVACPKDLAMFQDAVKTVGAEDRLKVVDLGELVLEAIEGDAPVEAES